MSIFEYNEEEYMRLEREQWYGDGLASGYATEVARLRTMKIKQKRV